MKFVSFSGTATNDQAKGHWHWVHTTLSQFQQSQNFPIEACYVGTAGKADSETITGLTKAPYSSMGFKIKSAHEIFADYKKLTKYLNSNPEAVIFHVYEGGLSELLLVTLLHNKLKNLRILFNLHQAEDWANILESNDLVSKYLRTCIKKIFQSIEGCSSFSAESSKLADLASEKLEVKFDTYPVFSIYSTAKEIKQRQETRKTIDVLFAPGNIYDLNFCLAVANNFKDANLNLKLSLIWRSVGSRKLTTNERKAIDLLGIVFYDSPIAFDEYVRLHTESRICVLPYSSPYYVWGSSGRVNDCLVFKCLPLVPAGTALAARLRDSGLDVSLDRDSHEKTALAITSLAANFPILPPAVTLDTWKEWVVEKSNTLDADLNWNAVRKIEILNLVILSALLKNTSRIKVLDYLTSLIYKNEFLTSAITEFRAKFRN